MGPMLGEKPRILKALEVRRGGWNQGHPGKIQMEWRRGFHCPLRSWLLPFPVPFHALVTCLSLGLWGLLVLKEWQNYLLVPGLNRTHLRTSWEFA